MTLRLPFLAARLLDRLGVEQRYMLINGLGVILARGVGCGLILLITVLVTRALGAADYGRFAFFLSVAFLAVLFGGLGVPVATNLLLPRYRERGHRHRGSQFFLLGLITVFTGSGIAAWAAVIGIRYVTGNADMIPFPTGLAVAYISGTALISFLAPTCRAIDRPTAAALVDNIYPRVLVLAGMAALASIGHQLALDSVLMLWVIGSYGTVAIALLTVLRSDELEITRRRPIRFRQLRVWLSLSTTMMITPMFFFVLSETDILCLGFFSSPEDVGLYNVARRLAELMQFAYVSVNTLLLPRIAAAHSARDASRMQSIVDTMNVVVLVPAGCVLVALVAFGPQVLSLFGQSFVGGYLVVLVLAVARFTDLLLGPASEVLMMSGAQSRVARINIIAGLGNLGLNLLLVPNWGAIGAAAATTVSMVSWKLYLFVLCRRRTGVQTSLVMRLRALFDAAQGVRRAEAS